MTPSLELVPVVGVGVRIGGVAPSCLGASVFPMEESALVPRASFQARVRASRMGSADLIGPKVSPCSAPLSKRKKLPSLR